MSVGSKIHRVSALVKKGAMLLFYIARKPPGCVSLPDPNLWKQDQNLIGKKNQIRIKIYTHVFSLNVSLYVLRLQPKLDPTPLEGLIPVNLDPDPQVWLLSQWALERIRLTAVASENSTLCCQQSLYQAGGAGSFL